MVKPGLEKQPNLKQGATLKTPDFTGELIPAASYIHSGKSHGNPVVELTTPNGTINLSEGTNKNELWV